MIVKQYVKNSKVLVRCENNKDKWVTKCPVQTTFVSLLLLYFKNLVEKL